MKRYLLLGMGLFLALGMSGKAYSQGAIISAAGPVHRGMGGASTAAPISALGALYWNPATISGLEHSELEVGVDLLFTDHNVSSSVGPFGGSTDADPGTFPVPNFGWVHHLEDSPFTLGLGVNSVAGFKTSLPSDSTNPVLMPQPSGLGRISSEATFLQIAPVLSVILTDRLSVAAGPVITTAQVGLEPFVFDSANSNNTYSAGRATKYHWGGGFQAGMYYILNDAWHVGASYKSKAWMETFEFMGVDENGVARTLTTEIDLPTTVSLGLGFTGFDKWLFAADARFIDYENADGFGDRASYDATGKLNGLDWSSVFALALGAQRSINDRIYLRMGYTYNQNPIQNNESFFNLASPLIYEHMLSAGGSFKLNDKVSLNAGYSHYFENAVTGPIIQPGTGALAGSSVTNTMSADFLSFGILMRQ
ncbi:Outer membrane protein transport protein (OMPP1/FadL/TodX) [Rubripirellula lacrimiformis]|uniref:Outer membrane protein transport protein (OMPP1/FadL/TodX) n=1 Tax=Rubripirellula lacrimiformis TaxID=1930273 RepID=A0A517N8T8_9BACT|nr:outer membrane protein transport protein [Rubripirellula lacrimiformis]QDT03418.1 Outer membrane protein transport protein (OMPP1/FadL/TodX) [Rubripirellula lacrimiformis]